MIISSGDLVRRNAAFAATGAFAGLPFPTSDILQVLGCVDSRVDPSDVLGLKLGEGVVMRNIGGRITPAIIADIAYVGYLVDTKAPEGPYFEVAIIHHTDCGSTLLADDDLRYGFAQRIGTDERALADTPVLDPARTVQTDVNRVLWAEEIPDNVHASGHVYDVGTGLVTTIIDARARK